MTAYRVKMTALNDPTIHDVRDVEADSMGDAIAVVARKVRSDRGGVWEPEEARRIWRPMLNPVEDA